MTSIPARLVPTLIALALAAPLLAVDVDDTRLLSEPAISDDHVVFVYADDLWVAPRAADAKARRLTSHPGLESAPRISPDGTLVAFSAEYDGNVDVYVVPVSGGEPKRLTWHPDDDDVLDFTPAGDAVLFRSQRAAHTRRHHQLYTVPVDGGWPSRLPIPHAFKAAYSPDGAKIAYVPHREAFNQWKNYRGGTASRIWIYDVGDHSVIQIPQPPGRSNDTDPMWIGDRVFFRSDREGELNLFSYDPASEEIVRHTEHEDFPILHATASAAGTEIVYEQAGYLHVFDPQSGGSQRLRIGVAADLIEARPRYASGWDFVREVSPSPSGARVAIGFRGEIVTVPAEKGDPRNLTRTPGVHERRPAWSPDGTRIAYLSDASGEYALHVAPQDGRGEVRTYELGGAGFYLDLAWAPDGKKLSFADNAHAIYWIDLDDGTVHEVAANVLYGPTSFPGHAWSPDSRWLAYDRSNAAHLRQVFVHDTETGTSHPVTDGLSDAYDPVFDRGGKYLYFLASTDAGPLRDWFALSRTDMESTQDVYFAVLSADEPSPLEPESDEEGQDDSEDSDSGDSDSEDGDSDDGDSDDGDSDDGDSDDGDSEDGVAPVTIDVAGLGQRILALPIGTASRRALAAGEAGEVYYLEADRPAGARYVVPADLERFTFEKREAKTVAGDVMDYAVSADRGKILARTEDELLLLDAGKDDQKGEPVDVDAVAVRIEPRAEWRQIFDEAWRINRDYFYDPGMHGADWPAMREKYAQFLPHLATRFDLNRVLRWMSSELAVGHHRVGGGDRFPDPEPIPGGLLGADYEIDRGRYRFAKVYGGLNWNPDLRAPLTEPGVGVRAGEYLLAVDGRDLRPPENLYAPFERTAGTIVELRVGPRPDGRDARTVRVVPIESERALRNRDWVEGNLRKVTEATDGRVAYVHVPDTADQGHEYFKRYFYPQADRDAIIIDERYNGGGLVADYYIDILRRPHVAHWATRYGQDLKTPLAAIQGPKVMIIDETAGSGGDLLPWMFRKFELGTLVGRPTWGGLVGILGFPTLMDGGGITAPNLAIWTEDGFIVENVGVPPDVEVEQLPADVIAGRDPQLEKAIEIALEELEKNPPPEYQRPPFPVRARR